MEKEEIQFQNSPKNIEKYELHEGRGIKNLLRGKGASYWHERTSWFKEIL